MIATIRKAGDFTWAVDEIRSPHAFLDGDVLKLYFAGHELNGTLPEHFAVGMMTCGEIKTQRGVLRGVDQALTMQKPPLASPDL